jgi:hypothetical protein
MWTPDLRRHRPSLVLVWLLLSGVLTSRADAQTRPPIEAAMREIQARCQARYSGAPFYYATSSPPRYWPPCDPEGDGGGPAFPPDGYYDAWFDTGVPDSARVELTRYLCAGLWKALGEENNANGGGDGWLRSDWRDPEGMTWETWNETTRDVWWYDFATAAGLTNTASFNSGDIDEGNYEAVISEVLTFARTEMLVLPLSANFVDCDSGAGIGTDSCDSDVCETQTDEHCGLEYLLEVEAAAAFAARSQELTCGRIATWANWGGTQHLDGTWTWQGVEYGADSACPASTAKAPGVVFFYLALQPFDEDMLSSPDSPVPVDELFHLVEGTYAGQVGEVVKGQRLSAEAPEFPWSCDDPPTEPIKYGWMTIIPDEPGNAVAPYGIIGVLEPFFNNLDSCPSDCAGSTTLDPQGPNPAEEGEEDDCDPNSQAKTSEPVSLTTGEKLESATDVSVRLRGRDFSFAREYTSRYGYRNSTSGNLVGSGWSANVFQSISLADDDLVLSGPPMHYARTFYEVPSSDPSEWAPQGPSKQTIKARAIRIAKTIDPLEEDSIYTVYSLEEPGQWTKYFYREPTESEEMTYQENHLADFTQNMKGLLLAEVDPTGQNTWVYQYLSTDSSTEQPRLCCIYFNPALTGDAGFTSLSASLTMSGARALARFHWHWDEGDLEGKLSRIDIERFVGNTASTEVEQRVVYTYADDATVHADVGAAAMLVQVAHSVKVDGAPEGVDPLWTRYTQYRYHDGTTATDAFETEGDDGELKIVIRPEQIEYYANARTLTSWAPEDAVAEAAAELLNMADGDEEDGLSPVDLAAKVVGYDTGRVSVQYLQSSCGCGGSAAQGLRQIFTYSGPYDTNGLSTRIQEQTYDGDSWEDYRIRYVDQRRYGTGAVPYKVIEALHDPISGRTWANHYVYDTTGGTRTMLKHYTPSAIASYTPYSASPSTFPSVTLETSGGLAYQYEYNAEKRRTKTYVGTRVGGADDFDLVSETEYEAGVRSDLPAMSIRYVVAGTSDPDEKEVTTYDYVLSDADAVLMMSMSVERELSTENGPGAGVYISHEIFDGWGRNTWSVAPDDSLSCRMYDYDHGGVIVSVANANRSGGSNYGACPGMARRPITLADGSSKAAIS